MEVDGVDGSESVQHGAVMEVLAVEGGEDGKQTRKSRSKKEVSNKKDNNKKGRKKKQQNGEEDSLTTIEKLSKDPYSLELHLAAIQEATTPELREQARSFMAQMIPLPEHAWLDWINDAKLVDDSLETKVQVLELFKRACTDMLSIKLHCEYTHYVLSLYFESRGFSYPKILEQDNEDLNAADESKADISAASVFDEEFVDGEMLAAVNENVRWHLSEGQTVWLILHNFELFRLKQSPTEEAVRRMELFYQQRLCEPHLQLAETHQLFSSFVSAFKDASYEESLVSAQPLYNATKAVIEIREPEEDRLSRANFSLEAFQAYISWEQEVKKPSFPIVRALYLRALARFPVESTLWHGYLSLARKATSTPRELEGVEESSWSPDLLTEAFQIATRYLPFSGEVVSLAIRGMESVSSYEDSLLFAQAQVDRALDGPVGRTSLEDTVEIVIASADIVRHATGAEEDQVPESLVTLLRRGMAKVKEISSESGDPHLRIEKYLFRQFERRADFDTIDATLASLSQSYPSSAVVLVTRTEYLIRQNKLDAARKLFQSSSKKRFDYPEFIFEAWVNFEHRDGSLATLEKALAHIEHEMQFVQARREREARLEMANALAKVDEALPAATQSDNGPVDNNAASDGKKRRALEMTASLDEKEPVEESNKKHKAETDEVQELKRDRENSTVAVTGLAVQSNEDAVRKLFRDCGEIREVKVRALATQAVATVELMSRAQVPAALTKDKKRIDSQEVEVAPVWKATLYVTNFPEKYDAADMQQLFEPYGPIFEIRWPSRRLKATRRFVYVQYVDESSAQRALALHNKELIPDSGQRLQVWISDPLRKQTRTDANAAKRELYITGLTKQATEADLRKLFEPFGTIRGCRVPQDDSGVSRGIGFVDFDTEESASAALSMNNHEVKGRRLAVVLADSKIAHKAKPAPSGLGRQTDVRNRSIRAIGLPPDTQEPLLQQFFDTYGKTSAVDVHGSTAVITFEDPADAAKILLNGEVVYQGSQLSLKEHHERHRKANGASTGENTAGPSANAGFLPRANRGRGKKLGIGAGRGNATRSREVTDANSETPTSTTTVVEQRAGAEGRKQADFKAMLLGGGSNT